MCGTAVQDQKRFRSSNAATTCRTLSRWKAMKSLYLLRHAKSSWKDPGLDDHNRPLNKRGRQAAKIMATYLKRSKIIPDLVICSTATRAKQTLDPIVKAINPPKVILERKIFGGTQKELWEQLWDIHKSAKSVLLIGHNPALQNLALELAQTEKPLPFAGNKFPTGAIIGKMDLRPRRVERRGVRVERPKPHGRRKRPPSSSLCCSRARRS
jgi:phosphohistidine phosphatase